MILPGNLVRIVDRGDGTALPVGAIGEIAVKGTTLMLGYVKKLPEECFDEDGFFFRGTPDSSTARGTCTGRAA